MNVTTDIIEDQPGVNDYLGLVIALIGFASIAIIGGMLRCRYKHNRQKSTVSEKDRQDDKANLQEKAETTPPINILLISKDFLAEARNSFGSGNPALVREQQESMGSMSNNANRESSSNEHDMEFVNHAPLPPPLNHGEFYV